MSKEYKEEYMKSLMSGMTEEELNKLFALAESYYLPANLLVAKSEARQVIKLREDMDARLAAYRNN